MPDIHLRYGGSTMHRTVACNGWRTLADQLPPQANKPSPSAARGSCLHELVEICINDEKPAHEWLDYHSDVWDYTVTEDDVLQLESAVKQFNQVMLDLDLDEWVTEEFVQLTDLIGGSADIIACGAEKAAIIDWKFGHSPVEAKGSWQGITYLLAAANSSAVKDMVEDRQWYFVVIQPSVSDIPSVHEYLQEEVDEKTKDINHAIFKAESGEGELVPGDHCQFCPAGPICDAKIVQAGEAATFPDLVTLNLGQALELAEQLEPWIKEVKNFAHKMKEEGWDDPRWKLVDKRATRKWIQEEELARKLNAMRRLKLAEYSNISMKSPAQLEKVCKAKKINFDKEFGPFVTKQSSGTTLVRDTDYRPEVLSQGNIREALASLNEKET